MEERLYTKYTKVAQARRDATMRVLEGIKDGKFLKKNFNLLKENILIQVERTFDSKTKTFELFSESAKGRGYTAKIDRGRGKKLLERGGNFAIPSGFFAEDKLIIEREGPKVQKIVYIPEKVIFNTDILLGIKPELVNDAFWMIIAHEDHERELRLKEQKEKAERGITESEVNDHVMKEIENKNEVTEKFSNYIAYACLVFSNVDVDRQIENYLPDKIDENVRKEIERIVKEEIDYFYPILHKEEIEMFTAR